MTDPPGTLRPVNPDAEAARLAEARKDPPGREWGVRHPYAYVEGPKLRADAVSAVEQYSNGAWCALCQHVTGDPAPERPHTVAYRDVPPWRDG